MKRDFESLDTVVEQFTGRKPQHTILHLIENGTYKPPVVQTPEGLGYYIGRNLSGRFFPTTFNAAFTGKGAAEHANRVLNHMGFVSFDVTDILREKLGMGPDEFSEETMLRTSIRDEVRGILERRQAMIDSPGEKA